MKIGIIADTHNRIDLTIKAIDIFKENKVDYVIHAGDLTSPKMLDLFEGCNCKFVLGNSDIDERLISLKSEGMGFGCIEKTCTFELDGKSFIVFHGDDVPSFRQAVSSGKYNYIIKGHTHFFENYVSNNVRVINPGCLYRGDECSIAILDVENDSVERIKVEID
ncbi:metallophosphoesterase family protein [Spirochaetota bacterium]